MFLLSLFYTLLAHQSCLLNFGIRVSDWYLGVLKQFDSYYYHPATVGRGSPALLSGVGGNDRQRPNSSGAVIDASNQVSSNCMTSSRSSSKLGGNRVAYTDLSPQQDSSNVSSHHQARSSSSMSSQGAMTTPPISNPSEYAILKFNTSNIGTEIDV